jgi:iron complex outermembrane recepter protein
MHCTIKLKFYTGTTMYKLLLTVIIFKAFGLFSLSQNGTDLKGFVSDERHQAMPGATVLLKGINRITVTDRNGYFIFTGLTLDKYQIEVSFIGYKPYSAQINLTNSTVLNIHLEPALLNLQEVLVTDHYAEERKAETPLNVEVVNSDYIRQNQGNSLMKSLERLPGVSTIDIGAGQSKPVIRGLGFNRVVVIENGIRHEGQQWGADHGLEIDQYAAGRVEVVRGPSSLQHGSDAIGGVVQVKHEELPRGKLLGGILDLTAKSNNQLGGGSLLLYSHQNRFTFGFRATLVDYADYRVPTDSVDIYSYRAPLHERKMRNTAGNEKNLHFTLGYSGEKYSGKIYVSNLNTKMGFFANAHGLEPRMVDTQLHDRSDRDINYPYQTVNHFKIVNRNTWQSTNSDWKLELGYQNNFRQEWSQYVNHGYMPPIFPASQLFTSDLERAFNKHIFTGNLTYNIRFSEHTNLLAGFNSDFQNNTIDGRGFIIPSYEQFSTGAFLYLKHTFSDNTLVHLGLRNDFGHLTTKTYTDWYPSPHIENNDTVWVNLERAPALKRTSSSFTWSVGINQQIDHLRLKANLGKSFRIPLAKELAANGVNYHQFSYEKGNPTLRPETAYQLDVGAEWHTRTFAIELSPFATYFPNYIYLNPTHLHDRLYGNGHQVFEYTQSQVWRLGGEMHAHYQVIKPLQLGLIANYVYSRQVSGSKAGFTLPFSPPPSVLLKMKYSRNHIWFVKHSYIMADLKLAAPQNRVVPPEEKTPGYGTVNLGIGGTINNGKQTVDLALQVQNLLNHKYYNHSSYYRLINVPEPGRNIVLNINIPFVIN